MLTDHLYFDFDVAAVVVCFAFVNVFNAGFGFAAGLVVAS